MTHQNALKILHRLGIPVRRVNEVFRIDLNNHILTWQVSEYGYQKTVRHLDQHGEMYRSSLRRFLLAVARWVYSFPATDVFIKLNKKLNWQVLVAKSPWDFLVEPPSFEDKETIHFANLVRTNEMPPEVFLDWLRDHRGLDL